ncbi:MAG: mobile mystery protein B [Bacteroidales bacterium]|nr:mobile mystery protein B [Bacteroidales bacterium]
MGLDLKYINGQTPLDEDEKEGLKIETIATREELDEFEQNNIEEASMWILSKRFTIEKLMTESFIRILHKRMYGKVWSWAGKFRTTNKNIGIDKWQISTALKSLLDDTLFWVENDIYVPDEIAIRFKHRLVSIHCFPNGNGRHSRLMADIIIDKVYNRSVFTWGTQNLVKQSKTRDNYLIAVRKANQNDYVELLEFARS